LRVLLALRQPLLLFGDLRLLSLDELIGPLLDAFVLAVLENGTGHINRALVMRDHRANERNVRIACLGGRLLGQRRNRKTTQRVLRVEVPSQRKA
jgi:hypothetical protein